MGAVTVVVKMEVGNFAQIDEQRCGRARLRNHHRTFRC